MKIQIVYLLINRAVAKLTLQHSQELESIKMTNSFFQINKHISLSKKRPIIHHDFDTDPEKYFDSSQVSFDSEIDGIYIIYKGQ